MKRAYYLGTLLAMSVLIVVVLSTSLSSEGYSLVYFENATIPSHVTVNTTYILVFDVLSHERHTEVYTYEVFLNGKEIEKGRFTLEPGGRTQVPIKFSVSKPEYSKVVTENISTVNTLSGVYNVSGDCLVANSTTFCLPPMYKVSNFNFVMNCSSFPWIITSVVKTRSGAMLKVQEYKLRVTRINGSTYQVITQRIAYQVVPEPVTLVVVVNSSTGKTYRLEKSFQVVSGGER